MQGQDIQVIGELVGLRLAHNSGVAFSLPITGWLQVALTVLIIMGISFYAVQLDPIRKNIFTKFAYTSVIFGAIANAIDRIMIGRVVDFISVKYFAIFNVADIFITL